MKSGFTFSQFHLPVTQGRVYWFGAIQWERMVAKPTPQNFHCTTIAVVVRAMARARLKPEGGNGAARS